MVSIGCGPDSVITSVPATKHWPLTMHTPLGHVLGDYMIALERRLPEPRRLGLDHGGFLGIGTGMRYHRPHFNRQPARAATKPAVPR